MEEMGKHLFIAFYIIAIVLGVFLITLNQIYIHKTKDEGHRKLQYFNLAFLFHIAISFVYFYRLYFALGWQSLGYILIAVNASLVLTIYYGTLAAAEFNGIKIPHHKPLALFAGVQYVVVYNLTSRSSLIPTQGTMWRESDVFYYTMSIIFFGTVAYVCGYLLATSGKEGQNSVVLWCFRFFVSLILLMTAFNFWVDYNFYFSCGRTLFWGINVYNVIVVLYVVLSALSAVLFFRNDNFRHAVFQPEGPSAEKQAVSSVTIEAAADRYGLTNREQDVMKLICEGKSGPNISELLTISEQTVKRHTNSVYKKVDVKSRYELISLIKNEAQGANY